MQPCPTILNVTDLRLPLLYEDYQSVTKTLNLSTTMRISFNECCTMHLINLGNTTSVLYRLIIIEQTVWHQPCPKPRPLPKRSMGLGLADSTAPTLSKAQAPPKRGMGLGLVPAWYIPLLSVPYYPWHELGKSVIRCRHMIPERERM